MLLGLVDKELKLATSVRGLTPYLINVLPIVDLNYPNNFVTLLGEVDMEASFKAISIRGSRHITKASSILSKMATGDVQNSHLAERPLKTTHR